MEEEKKEISLSEYGWNGCSIPTNLDDLVSHLPTWRHLHVLRSPEIHKNRQLCFPWNKFYGADGTAFLPAFELGSLLSVGSYGKVYRSQRAVYHPIQDLSENRVRFERSTPFHEIVTKINAITFTLDERNSPFDVKEKIYFEEIEAFLYEATLHAIIYKVFETHGYSTVIPRLYEVFANAESPQPTSPIQISEVIMNMELVEGATLFDILRTHFNGITTQRETEEFLLDILIQLCVYLDLLQTDLRFNHRDLKINNILIRSHTRESKWSRIITHSLMPEPWKCKSDVVIIDFGFSCIACDGPSKKPLIQAGSWFSMRHDCMKKGRDLALFLYSLEAYYPLKSFISDELYTVLKTVMVAIQQGGSQCQLWNGVSDVGVPNKTPVSPLPFSAGIYKFLRFSDVEIPGCEPRTLLPRLLQFYKSHSLKN